MVCFARFARPGASHFLEGVAAELRRRGHDVHLARPDAAPEEACDDADMVVVHDGLIPDQVTRIGRHHRHHGRYRLLFRHAALQGLDPRTFDLADYDGVLAASSLVADFCRRHQIADHVWVWPDAADTRRFRPEAGDHVGDVVFFGAWGDQSRGVELRHFLLEPVRLLGLRARAYGPPFPAAALAELDNAGIKFGGWAPHDVMPAIFGRFHCTIHVPSRARSRLLPGLPSIRLFEAMACGIPVVTAPWIDSDGLFTVDRDFLVAPNGAAMRRHLRALIQDGGLRAEIGSHARRTILARHSCAHRAEQLLDIYRELTLYPAALPMVDPWLFPSRQAPGQEAP